MTQGSAIELLFGSYRRQILGFLLLRPDQSFHVRELSRLTGVPVGSLHRELTALAEAGVLTRTPAGNQVLYQVHRGCPLFDALVGIFTAAPQAEPAEGAEAREPAAHAPPGDAPAGAGDVLGRLGVGYAELAAVCQAHGVRRLWFYGSAARGELANGDDVDVMVAFAPGEAPDLFGLVDLRHALARLFGGREVDVITEGAVRNPIHRKTIERDRVEAYAP